MYKPASSQKFDEKWLWGFCRLAQAYVFHETEVVNANMEREVNREHVFVEHVCSVAHANDRCEFGLRCVRHWPGSKGRR